MEEESTFFPHYLIPINIIEPAPPKKFRPSPPGGRNILHIPNHSTWMKQNRKAILGEPVKKADLVEWCDENLGAQHYHLGEDKVIVYCEENVMAVKLRWL